MAQSVAPYEGVFAPNVFVNDVPIGGLGPQGALEKLRAVAAERLNSWNLAVAYQGHTFVTLNYGTLGLSVPDEELFAALNDAWALTHTGTVHDRRAAIDALEQNPYRAYTTQHEADQGALTGLLEQIAPYVNAAPVDAALLVFQPDSAEPFLFREDRPGAWLDVGAARQDILARAAAGESGTYTLMPQVIQPQVTLASVKEKVALRASASTAISTSSTENRNHNIQLSLSRFNGKVLEP
ncbi:MAG TPA: hypothetical protein VLA21_11840, partial [Candidatus Limnocylindria bacterium]|nr:hypothetical protein [Candidatus Limnocylindria bacterium]